MLKRLLATNSCADFDMFPGVRRSNKITQLISNSSRTMNVWVQFGWYVTSLTRVLLRVFIFSQERVSAAIYIRPEQNVNEGTKMLRRYRESSPNLSPGSIPKDRLTKIMS